jgi:integrase
LISNSGCAFLEDATDRVKLIARGVLDPAEEALALSGRAPIEHAIQEYASFLRSKKNSRGHITEAVRCIRAILGAPDPTPGPAKKRARKKPRENPLPPGIRAKSLGEITAVKVEKWLNLVCDIGRSARTRNVYLARLNGLLNWADARGMIRGNPIQVIQPLNEDADRREISRALTPEEFARLISVSPRERALYYLMAGRVGLRWQEIRRLLWGDLADGWVSLRIQATKSKRADALPIPDDVWAQLQAIRPPDATLTTPVFLTSPSRITFGKDLKRAGISKHDERGHQADRKALRKTFGTHLAMAGVDIRQAQQLMRHTDVNLTLKLYTDPKLLDLKAAMERTAEMMPGAEAKPAPKKLKKHTA